MSLSRPFRSVLYLPAANARALEKARGLPADAIIFDLEDAVAPAEKGAARDALLAALAQDYAPLTDMRASSTYRMRTAQNLLRRFWLETRIDAPLANTDVNAFAA